MPDRDRPLNKRGRKTAPRMGRLLREKDLVPDLILSSVATRARTTADLVAESSGFDGTIQLVEALYNAGPPAHIDVLRAVSDACPRVLLVGHNPGLEDLLTELTGRTEPLPTAALAHLVLDLKHWRDLGDASHAELIDIWRPKELD